MSAGVISLPATRQKGEIRLINAHSEAIPTHPPRRNLASGLLRQNPPHMPLFYWRKEILWNLIRQFSETIEHLSWIVADVENQLLKYRLFVCVHNLDIG